MSIIRGAVFDLDGTLLDSMNFWKDCGKDFVRAHGIEPEDGLSEKLYRMSMAQGAHYLKQTYFPSATEEEIIETIDSVSSLVLFHGKPKLVLPRFFVYRALRIDGFDNITFFIQHGLPRVDKGSRQIK